MPQHICNGTMIMCNFGMAPSTLTALPHGGEDADEQPQATILDHLPMVNIPPFALCMSPANPELASATVAAMGALIPTPCRPVTPAPWTPGSHPVPDGDALLLDSTSSLQCQWGRAITLLDTRQAEEEMP